MADVKLPLVGEVKKGYVYAGAAVIVGIVGYVYIKRKNAAAAQASTTSSSGTVTDPAGNVCAALDPASGYCPGTPEDEQYQQQASAAIGQGYDEYPGGGAGQYLITDANGNQCVALDPSTGLCPVSTPGGGGGTTTVTTNAQWVVEAEDQLGNTSTVQAALGYALSGSPVTPQQKDIFMEAVGLLGAPPQGYPPLNVQGSSGSPPPKGSSVTVPNVKNQRVNPGEAAILAAGLVPDVTSGGPRNPVHEYVIISQTPGGGTRVSRGSKVSLSIKQT